MPLSSSSPLSNVSSNVDFVFRAVATWSASFGLGNLYPFPKALEYLGEKVLIKVTADAAAKEWIPDVYEQRALVLNCL